VLAAGGRSASAALPLLPSPTVWLPPCVEKRGWGGWKGRQRWREGQGQGEAGVGLGKLERGVLRGEGEVRGKAEADIMAGETGMLPKVVRAGLA